MYLYCSVEGGHMGILKYFLENDVSFHADKDGRTNLMQACRYEHINGIVISIIYSPRMYTVIIVISTLHTVYRQMYTWTELRRPADIDQSEVITVLVGNNLCTNIYLLLNIISSPQNEIQLEHRSRRL